MKFVLLFFMAATLLSAQDVQKKEPQYYAAPFTRGAGWDTTKGATQPHFKEHGLNLSRLKKEGKISIGARYGETGLVVFTAESEEEVRGHFLNDSLVQKDILRMKIMKFTPFYKGCIE